MGTVTTRYLEMTRPDQLKPSRVQVPGFALEPVEDPQLNRALYTRVGARWHWKDRLAWTSSQWKDWALREQLETWIGRVDGDTAGYFELELQSRSEVEIAYFGLLPDFIGRGLGGVLLTGAIRRAWAMGAARVWVHTCTLDHPQALANYEARGMRVYRIEETATDPGSDRPAER
jgi:GNAT superfamily N-acetyltransferase